MYSLLNPFPIQFLALFAYLILRLFVGGLLIWFGHKHFSARSELKGALRVRWWPFSGTTVLVLVGSELILGAMFVLGAYTQVAALLTIGLCLKMLFFRFRHPAIPPRSFYVLLLAAALSLFITGAGALAIDLPI